MSYDLYFYRKKGSGPTEAQVREYLNANVKAITPEQNQWFYENEDTEVYFLLDQNDPETDPESIERFESFNDFDNTHFTLNLNYLRPDFFGLEAFAFVDKMIEDLDAFVLNPQASDDPVDPTKPEKGALYNEWSTLNAQHTAHFYQEMDMGYLDKQKANRAWQYNSMRKDLQARLGNEYFVPKVFFLRTKADKRVVTLCTWTQHIPNVFPPADYYLLSKKVKKLFKTVDESGIINSDLLHSRFKNQLEDLDSTGCQVMHPGKAFLAKDLFNSTPLEQPLSEFGERLEMDKLATTKP